MMDQQHEKSNRKIKDACAHFMVKYARQKLPGGNPVARERSLRYDGHSGSLPNRKEMVS
jgi:hypothetical protein